MITKLSQDKIRRSGRLCFDLVMSTFVMVFNFKLDFAERHCKTWYDLFAIDAILYASSHFPYKSQIAEVDLHSFAYK